jgi:hypothetical protein
MRYIHIQDQKTSVEYGLLLTDMGKKDSSTSLFGDRSKETAKTFWEKIKKSLLTDKHENWLFFVC